MELVPGDSENNWGSVVRAPHVSLKPYVWKVPESRSQDLHVTLLTGS